MSPVHVERLGIVIHDLPDSPMLHVSTARFGVPALQGDGLAVWARRAYHHEDPGAHGRHPARHILLEHVVICRNLDPGEWLPII